MGWPQAPAAQGGSESEGEHGLRQDTAMPGQLRASGGQIQQQGEAEKAMELSLGEGQERQGLGKGQGQARGAQAASGEKQETKKLARGHLPACGARPQREPDYKE